jgi:Icc protein
MSTARPGDDRTRTARGSLGRLAWLTDVHLNFVAPQHVDKLCRSIRALDADAVLLTGDIAEAPDVVEHLEGLDARLGLPLYFVLGNHDFYRGGIASVRAEIEGLCARSPRLCWLPGAGVVPLTEAIGLVGHDGWADGRFGDHAGSDVLLNDYLLIEELAGLEKQERLERLHALGDEAAAHFRRVLPGALARFHRLIVLTHEPPFRESCWHRGQVSDDDRLPHFSCKAVGEALVEAMVAHPDRELTVLCGHTHSAGEAQILPNLCVLTGGAEYGRPRLQRVLEIE